MHDLIRSILHKASTPVVLLDGKGLIHTANHPFLEMTGRKSPEVSGQPFDGMLLTADRDGLDMDAGSDPDGIGAFFYLGKAGGNLVPVRMEKFEFDHGGVKGSLVFLFDCSELENLRADHLHMARLASLGRLLSGVIHEISNPLAIIHGCAQLLAARELPPDIRSDVERICSESTRSGELVKNVLSFARKKKEFKERFPVQKVIEEASVLKQYSLKKNNIKLHYTPVHAPPLFVSGFKTELMQVVLNLINNSEQAINESTGEGIIGIRLVKDQSHAVVDISDSGRGIDPEDRTRIFDAFFTTKGAKKGTGLGLYISRNIVRKHGGDLRLMENHEGNTCFQIRLPLCHDKGAVDSELEGAGTP